MERGLHPGAKGLVEALWAPCTVEDAWKVASDYLWKVADETGASLGSGHVELDPDGFRD
jgi:hypothetical protein